MLTINAPSGNLFAGKDLPPVTGQNLEKLQLTRPDLAKKILRKKTDRGTDVAIRLDRGIALRHGDLLEGTDGKILVEQLPEKVLRVKLKTLASTDVFIMLGHMIGNQHRPVSIENNAVCFPIQADSEYDTFAKLLCSIEPYIEITTEEMVFHPHTGADIHGH